MDTSQWRPKAPTGILKMSHSCHPLLRAIGLAIRSLRRERGISQESLAGLTHIDRSYISNVERGLRNVSIVNVSRIADALGVSLRDLIGRASWPAAPTITRSRVAAMTDRTGEAPTARYLDVAVPGVCAASGTRTTRRLSRRLSSRELSWAGCSSP